MARVEPPSPRALARISAGAVVLAAIVLTLGVGPFLHGILSVSWPSVVIAVALSALATASAVWRWRVVATGFGIELPWRGALAAYYRSQFLNTVLPGGVLGDVHRAYRHGRRLGSVALAARVVATERVAGQAVQFGLVAIVLSVLGLSSPLHALAWVIGGVVVLVAIALGILAMIPRGRRRLLTELTMLGRVFGDPPRAVKVVVSSILVIAAHTTVFVVACVATGVSAPLSDLVIVALIALTASALPINVGGWGPREGAAASAFAVLGLGGVAGVAASTAFGVLATIAVLPGAAVLVGGRIAAARERRRERSAHRELPAEASTEYQLREEGANA